MLILKYILSLPKLRILKHSLNQESIYSIDIFTKTNWDYRFEIAVYIVSFANKISLHFVSGAEAFSII